MTTAVEWYNEEINKLNVGNDARVFIAKLFEQTKEMEKKQKMDFANWCRIHENLNKNKVFTIQQLFDKYQKETFKLE